MEKVIFEAVNLSKEIEGNLVLQNLSFKFEDNEAAAIQGHNGSGKSTLLKILAGIYEPSSGKIKRNTRKIGYVPEHFPENLRFKLKEYLVIMSSFHGISRKSIEFELSKLIDLFEIEQFLEVPLKQCSKGTKQKVGIIQALLAKPDVLLLDEPLTGLDNSSQRNLIHLLEKLKKEVTVIFTTHEDVMIEKLANQILYIESRGILFSNETRKKKRLIKVEFPQKEVFKELDSIHIQYEGNIAVIEVDSAMCDQILISLLNKQCSVLEVREMR